MYDIFDKYGPIHQIRIGNMLHTGGKKILLSQIRFICFDFFLFLGMVFVVYENIFHVKNACDHLSDFNVCNRSTYNMYLLFMKIYFLFLGMYLVVLYYQAAKAFDRMNLDKEKQKLAKIQANYGLYT